MTSIAAEPPPLVRDGHERPPLRVAFCIDNLRGSGGTELNAVRTAERLVTRGFEATLFSMQADGPMRARYEAVGIAVVHHSPNGSLVGRGALRGARAMARALRGGRFDVVHCHDKYSNVFGGLAARLAGVPLITSKRWWELPAAHRILNAAAYHGSTRVLANSDAVAESLRVVERVPRARIAVVPNFVDDEAFGRVAPEERAALRARFGVPAGAEVVGIVARLRPEKNHPLLLHAMQALARRRPNVHAVIVGDGLDEPHGSALPPLARSLGIADRVHFVGFASADERPHAAFDVSVLCSDHEGFPNSLVEAMAIGQPIVATRVGGVPDAVVDGVTGLLVPPRQPDALAYALDALLADPARAHAFGEAGYERAWARFRRDSVLATLAALYAQTALPRR